jgi:hypothetical protein
MSTGTLLFIIYYYYYYYYLFIIILESKNKVEKKKVEAVKASPQSIYIESQSKKSLGGSLHRLHLLHFILHRLHLFILYQNSRLLATFYTSSFTDYIHEATHLLTLLTLLTLLIDVSSVNSVSE